MQETSPLKRQCTRHKRRVLHARDPHCHWCDVVTIDPSKTLNQRHPNLATLDHVKSRLQCKTKEEYRSSKNHVIACLECNNLRDAIFLKTEKPQQKIAEQEKREKDAVTGPAMELLLKPAAFQTLAAGL